MPERPVFHGTGFYSTGFSQHRFFTAPVFHSTGFSEQRAQLRPLSSPDAALSKEEHRVQALTGSISSIIARFADCSCH
jgi:hypothetical protein